LRKGKNKYSAEAKWGWEPRPGIARRKRDTSYRASSYKDNHVRRVLPDRELREAESFYWDDAQ